MRVVLTAFGTTGDNAPIISIAEMLRAQGDEPLLLLNPLHAEAAASRRLPFVPLGPLWSPDEVANTAKYLHPLRGGIAIWNDFYLPNVRRTFAAVARAITDHRAEMVVSHWLCFGADFAARRAAVRHAVVNLAPCWWYSRRDPSIYAAFNAPRWLLRWTVALPRWVVNHFIGGSLRAVCRDLGVPHQRDIYFEMFRKADLNLALWSPSFRPHAEDDPARATICGFPWGSAGQTELAPGIERFLADGDPPLAVGLGSSAKTVGRDLYRRVGAACRDIGCRAVLVGAQPDAVDGLGGHVLAIPVTPYRSLFPRCRAVVHHGGIGTLAEALRAGRPAAILPFFGDQHDNARRARGLGAAVTWSPATLRHGKLPAALDRLVTDEALRRHAVEIGDRVRQDLDGAVVAARSIAGRG